MNSPILLPPKYKKSSPISAYLLVPTSLLYYTAYSSYSSRNMSESFDGWLRGVPVITKLLVSGTLLSGILSTFQFMPGHRLLLIWPYVTEQFEIWRLFSTFFFAGSFSFNFVMHLYILYENCRRYESNPFDTGGGGTSADFLWLLLSTMSMLLVVSYLFDLYSLSEPILYVVLYTWSRREPDALVNIFGFRFKAVYLPWVYVALRLLMGGSITSPLVGIAVGHVYFFLVQIFPTLFQSTILRTPKFCLSFVQLVSGLTPSAPPSTSGGSATLSNATRETENLRFRTNARNAARPATYNWGTGRTLGSN